MLLAKACKTLDIAVITILSGNMSSLRVKPKQLKWKRVLDVTTGITVRKCLEKVLMDKNSICLNPKKRIRRDWNDIIKAFFEELKKHNYTPPNEFSLRAIQQETTRIQNTMRSPHLGEIKTSTDGTDPSKDPSGKTDNATASDTPPGIVQDPQEDVDPMATVGVAINIALISGTMSVEDLTKHLCFIVDNLFENDEKLAAAMDGMDDIGNNIHAFVKSLIETAASQFYMLLEWESYRDINELRDKLSGLVHYMTSQLITFGGLAHVYNQRLSEHDEANVMATQVNSLLRDGDRFMDDILQAWLAQYAPLREKIVAEGRLTRLVEWAREYVLSPLNGGELVAFLLDWKSTGVAPTGFEEALLGLDNTELKEMGHIFMGYYKSICFVTTL